MKNKTAFILKNISFAIIAIFLTSCDQIEQVGKNTDSTILYKLSQLATWSVPWLLIGIIIYFFIAQDREEMRDDFVSGRNFSGKYETVFTKVPTGKIIKGDPEAARFIGIFWIICYPIGHLYYNLMVNNKIKLGDNIEFNIFIFIILIPVIILIGIGLTIHRVLSDKSNPLSKWLTKLIIYTVVFCFINMVFWIMVTHILK
ncbi:hypothetical protein [uncultured Algoriphagus sp.]|uniref:hypothetical protein n=1 Tax=uncultured Algoriphagus sp. TaxID=417365 RepID=UPI0030EE46DD|tara:strand:+ start:6814 stop:7416 length:603 start_codon:yes stop_codon:yes gene_type:complete